MGAVWQQLVPGTMEAGEPTVTVSVVFFVVVVFFLTTCYTLPGTQWATPALVNGREAVFPSEQVSVILLVDGLAMLKNFICH